MDRKDELVSSGGEDYWNSENDESDSESKEPEVPEKAFEALFAGFKQQIKEVLAEAKPPAKKKERSQRLQHRKKYRLRRYHQTLMLITYHPRIQDSLEEVLCSTA